MSINWGVLGAERDKPLKVKTSGVIPTIINIDSEVEGLNTKVTNDVASLRQDIDDIKSLQNTEKEVLTTNGAATQKTIQDMNKKIDAIEKHVYGPSDSAGVTVETPTAAAPSRRSGLLGLGTGVGI
jgi:hypothetical protein